MLGLQKMTKCAPFKRDLAISNLKKYTLKGTNHHQFLLAIPTVLTYTF